MKTRFLLWFAIFCISSHANAAGISLKTTSVQAEYVLPGQNADVVTEALHSSMGSFFESLPLNRRAVPVDLPLLPLKPSLKSYSMGPMNTNVFDCSNGTAEILKQSSPTKTQMAFNQDIFIGCVYPFQRGVKIYIQGVNIDAADSSLTAGLFTAISKGIKGTPSEYLAKRINDFVSKLKEKLPLASVLIQKIEGPGLQTVETDKEEIAKIITPEGLPKTPDISPIVPQVSLPSVGNQNPQEMLEARKNLTAMGLIYHNKEQYLDAVKRGDKLAIDLFVRGGGVDTTISKP